MTRVLRSPVHIGGTTYPAGSIPPEPIAARITDPRAWHDPEAPPVPAPVPRQPAPPPEPQYPEGTPDEGWTVKDLRVWAAAHDLDLGDARTKAQIFEALTSHPESGDR